jgi:hypothetical protein
VARYNSRAAERIRPFDRGLAERSSLQHLAVAVAGRAQEHRGAGDVARQRAMQPAALPDM